MLVFFLLLPTDIQNKLCGEVSEVSFNTRTAYDSNVFVFLSAFFPHNLLRTLYIAVVQPLIFYVLLFCLLSSNYYIR